METREDGISGEATGGGTNEFAATTTRSPPARRLRGLQAFVWEEASVHATGPGPTQHVRTSALTHSRTHALTHFRTHALTHSRTHALHLSPPAETPPSPWFPAPAASRRRCARGAGP